MTEYERFIRDAAIVRGIDPEVAVRVANSEGGVSEPARLGDFSGPPWHSGKSWWPFQLHYGGPGYEAWGGSAGMGNGFTVLTGWQPGDPAAWRDSVRYALNRARLGGWTPWYGAAHVGIGRWDGIDREHPWDAAAEVWDYERPQEPPMPDTPRLRTTDAGVRLRAGPTTDSAILATLPQGTTVEPLDVRAWRHVRTQGIAPIEGWMAADFLEDAPADPPAPVALAYNPDFVLRLQIQDFACSIRTTQMILESIGIDVNIGVLQDQMVPRFVTRELGLLDGTGAGIVQLLKESYGVEAHTLSPAEFAPLSHLAGTYPIALGGHGWNHWVAVRRFQDNRFVLANPGGTGPRYGQQTLDRQQFSDLGPFSAVIVTGKGG